MTSLFLTFQVILTILIVIVVLLQKSTSIGLGAYSGSNDSLFGAKGPANFMAKLTMILGFLFILNTITLAYLYNKAGNKSALDTTTQTQKSSPLPINPLTAPDDNNNPFLNKNMQENKNAQSQNTLQSTNNESPKNEAVKKSDKKDKDFKESKKEQGEVKNEPKAQNAKKNEISQDKK